jgi:hypothetical protein
MMSWCGFAMAQQPRSHMRSTIFVNPLKEDCPLSPSCSVVSLVLGSPCFGPVALAKPAQGGSERRGDDSCCQKGGWVGKRRRTVQISAGILVPRSLKLDRNKRVDSTKEWEALLIRTTINPVSLTHESTECQRPRTEAKSRVETPATRFPLCILGCAESSGLLQYVRKGIGTSYWQSPLTTAISPCECDQKQRHTRPLLLFFASSSQELGHNAVSIWLE